MANRSNTFRFIVVCGIDGSGKSYLLKNIDSQLPEWHLTHWSHLSQLNELGWAGVFRLGPHPADYIHTLSPTRRALFIATIVWSEFEELINPTLENSGSVLSDCYYYKFLAKEKVYNQVAPIFFELVEMLPKPDHIILVDVDPKIACERKPDFTSYETTGPSFEDRVSFQILVREQLFNLIDSVSHTIIDGNREKSAVLNEILTLLPGLKR